MKSSFTIIEIIFTIIIIAILSTYAIPKVTKYLSNSYIIKLKTDILTIQNGIAKFKNQQVLLNRSITLDSLDDNDTLLFNKVLTSPIVAKQEPSQWSKSSLNHYKAWINNNDFVEFIYNPIDLSFRCDHNIKLCQELE